VDVVYIAIGTAIISVATSIITVLLMMKKEIQLLNQMYDERTEYMLNRSSEIVIDFLNTNVRKP